MGWFSFEMVAAGSANVNVAAVTVSLSLLKLQYIQTVMVLFSADALEAVLHCKRCSNCSRNR